MRSSCSWFCVIYRIIRPSANLIPFSKIGTVPGVALISDKTSYRRNSQSPEPPRLYGLELSERVENLTGVSAALMPMHLSSTSWWRHQMETFSALLAICAGNSPGPGEFPTQRLVTRSFDVFFDLRPNKRSSKQSWDWWFGTLSRPLWRHCNVTTFRFQKIYKRFLSSTLLTPNTPNMFIMVLRDHKNVVLGCQ